MTLPNTLNGHLNRKLGITGVILWTSLLYSILIIILSCSNRII